MLANLFCFDHSRPTDRWESAVNVCGDGLVMLTFCLAIECLSTEQALAQRIPPTARTIEVFHRIKPQMSMKQVIDICGVPDEDIGSGIHVYVYKLSDGSLVRIGTPDKKRLIYVAHVSPNGEARSIIQIPQRKHKSKRRLPSARRPPNRWTRAAGACFATNLMRRRVV
jgi:hypothetical protein